MSDVTLEEGASRDEPFSSALRRSVGVVMIGATLSFLETTIVNVAMHTLAVDLQSGLGSVQWVVTSYLLALAAVIPATGWAARRFGAARVYVAALAVFTAGSVLCACAPSVGMLIAARVVQGIGGGAIMPVGTMLWTAQSSKAQMGRVMALIAIPIILAPTLGPTVGGLLIEGLGWRAIFWLNLPIGAVGILLAMRLLPQEGAEVGGPARQVARLDVLGLLLATGGMAGLTYGLADLGTAARWEVRSAAALLAGLAALACFVLHALRATAPLLDVRLYGARAFAASALATFALGAANFGGMILMPLYLQGVRGEGVIVAGLLVAPTGLGALLSAPFTDRYGAGLTSFAGAVVLVASTIPFVFLSVTTPYYLLCVVMVIRGLGFGLSIIPAMTAAYRSLPAARLSDATPQLNVLQRMGGAIGTAVFTLVLVDQLRDRSTLAEQADAYGAAFAWVLAVTICAAIPTLLLARIEHRYRRVGMADQ